MVDDQLPRSSNNESASLNNSNLNPNDESGFDELINISHENARRWGLSESYEMFDRLVYAGILSISEDYSDLFYVNREPMYPKDPTPPKDKLQGEKGK